jgi:hypothetical protein
MTTSWTGPEYPSSTEGYQKELECCLDLLERWLWPAGHMESRQKETVALLNRLRMKEERITGVAHDQSSGHYQQDNTNAINQLLKDVAELKGNAPKDGDWIEVENDAI